MNSKPNLGVRAAPIPLPTAAEDLGLNAYEIWRQRVKNDALNLVLEGETWTAVGPDFTLRLPRLPGAAAERLAQALTAQGLAGLVDVRNPLDLTPMAGEEAYEAAGRAMLECDQIDALLVSAVPLTPHSKFAESMASTLK